ncbi:MAG: hypothetical protein A3G34_11070 [Candidatus Lindowbacteria bacterium RIFCSPLOWO2_12_FULL_62_27]|nr:MAG: hypothetical protein A3G34_11070 [Candidatus Lindowbacteria bacterium RIFCSPLOWO2_12_FULL_62_27]
MTVSAVVKRLCGLVAALAMAAAPAGAAGFSEIVPTVGVLYFDNATGADHLSWLPKGFAELLIRDLARTGRVETIPREQVESAWSTYAESKSTAFANKMLAQRLGKILKATHLLAGRFTRRDTDLVIEIKLYDIQHARFSGWRQIEGPSDGVMYLLKQVGLKTFEMLKMELADRELIDFLQIPSHNLKALAFYSLGLDALDRGDKNLAHSHFRTAVDADRFFKPAVEAISGMAFVLAGKAILRSEFHETTVIGASAITSVHDLIELARTNAFDFSIGDPVATPIEGDTYLADVKLPLEVTVRPDYVNLWLYSIRRIGREWPDTMSSTRQIEFARKDLFDQPVVLSLPDPLARQWLDAWKTLTMRLVFQGPEGQALFETQKVPVLPLYIGNAEGQFAGQSSVHWRLATSFEVARVPKHFFEGPIQVSLEIDR